MHPSRRAPSAVSLARLTVETLEARDVPSVSVRLDYSYDTTGFFNAPARRAVLEHAAAQIAPRLQDSLAPIAPAGVNTWQAQFYNPGTRATVTLNNPAIGQDEVVIYIGAAPLGGSELGLTTSGGYTATGTKGWLDVIKARGQAGALATPKTDFATWGGMITFDSTAKWNAPGTDPTASQYDFESVALHEMMHVFGFGLGEPAFTRNVVGGVFTGPSVVAANGGAGVRTEGSPPDHFAPGTNYRGQESPMQPSLAPGISRHLTPLDYAALNDVGWNVSGSAPASTPVVTTPAVTVAPVATAPLAIPAVSAAPISAPAAVTLTPPSPSPIVASSLAFPAAKFAAGAAGSATVYGQFGEAIRTIVPFGAGYTAGVRVATADLSGDGTPDLIAATGPGVANQVKVYDGRTGNLVASLQPFEASFDGGLNLAVGDLTGDGRPDLVVAAGAGGGPRVAIFDGRSLMPGNTPKKLVGDFFAYESSLRNGATVSVGDVNGDGKADLVTGAGPGGAPRVTVFSGADILANRGANSTRIADFFVAGDSTSRQGTNITVKDVDRDGRADLVATDAGKAYIYTSAGISANYVTPKPGGPSAAVVLDGFNDASGISVG